MMYQDTWKNGSTLATGYRECASRYEIIRDECSALFGDSTPFSVLDIGAAQGYFCERLIEDFALCRVMAFEPRLPHPGSERLIWMRQKISLKDAQTLSEMMRFDVVLALSVLHHMTEPFADWIFTLSGLGDLVIAELAITDSRSSDRMAKCTMPAGARILGYAPSHIKRDEKRPIVAIGGQK